MERVVPLGAVDASRALDADLIAAAMRHPREIAREGDFIGRLSTRVFADDHIVVKRRAELEAVASGPERWVRARLDRERALGSYPAERTWFAVRGSDGEQGLGVADLRRRPLHLHSAAELDSRWLDFAREFAAEYSRAAIAGQRLDEGLSNFAWDGDRLRYLDDDLYVWDRGRGLAMALPVLPRRHTWLDAAHGEQLGRALRDGVLTHPSVWDVRTLEQDLDAADSGRSGFLAGVVAGLRARVRPAAAPAPLASVGFLPMPPGPAPERATPEAHDREVEPADAAASTPDPAAERRGTIALLSDVHGNLAALEAVLATPEVQAADRLLLLGDTVGYGPDPEECVARVRAEDRLFGVRGNHDLVAALVEEPVGFSRLARASMEWTRPLLSEASREWIRAQPERIEEGEWVAVHGAPGDPRHLHGYVYAMTAEDNIRALEVQGFPLAFHGHSHVAGAWTSTRQSPARFLPPVEPLHLGAEELALVCPGAIGQPRDGDARAAFALYDPSARRVDWHRVEYDVEATCRRLREEGLPEELADRLRAGR